MTNSTAGEEQKPEFAYSQPTILLSRGDFFSAAVRFSVKFGLEHWPHCNNSVLVALLGKPVERLVVIVKDAVDAELLGKDLVLPRNAEVDWVLDNNSSLPVPSLKNGYHHFGDEIR